VSVFKSVSECCGSECEYSEKAVRRILHIQRDCGLRVLAESPASAMHCLDHGPIDDGRPCTTAHGARSGSGEPGWALQYLDTLADIERAIRAGAQTPAEISRFLCPLTDPTPP